MNKNDETKKIIEILNDYEPIPVNPEVHRRSGRYPWGNTTDQNENKEKKDEKA